MRKVYFFIFLIFQLIIFSCSKESPNSQELQIAIKIVTNDGGLNTLTSQLIVYYSPDLTSNNPMSIDVAYNSVVTFNVDPNQEKILLYLKDTNYGFIEKEFDIAEIKSSSNENPLILKFNENLTELAFIATVNMHENVSNSKGVIDIALALENTKTYQIDWGDGSTEFSDAGYGNEHYYEPGTYIIKVYTRYTNNINTILLNVENYTNNWAKIANLELNNLDNLDLLWIGDHEFKEAKPFLSTVPNLKELHLTRGKMNVIDLTENTALEKLHLDNGVLAYYKEIKGFYDLKNMKSMGINMILDGIDLSQFPKLEIINFFYYNQIKEIDISKNPNLTEVILKTNPISSIDFSNNPNLTKLSLSNTYYVYSSVDLILDLSYLTKLDFLDLNWSGITVTKVPFNLEQIMYLDISKCTIDRLKVAELLIEGQKKHPRENVKIWGLGYVGSENWDVLKSYEDTYNWKFEDH